MSATSVLIVDDHQLIRDALRVMLEREPDLSVCGEATGVEEAMEQVHEHQPELVIVDINLRSGDGIDLIRRIGTELSSARVIVMSMYDERIYGRRAVNAGAYGYVNKHNPAVDILDAIRVVLSGGRFFSDHVLEAMDTAAPESMSPVDRLSDREFEVFRLIAEGLSVKQIALRMAISPKTVEYYRENAKRKLDLGSSAELLHFAIQWQLSGSDGTSPTVGNGA